MSQPSFTWVLFALPRLIRLLGVTDGDGVRPERASGLVVFDGWASRPTSFLGNHAMHRSRDYRGS